jgi:negative regulator of flagellin synthesis FlgM
LPQSLWQAPNHRALLNNFPRALKQPDEGPFWLLKPRYRITLMSIENISKLQGSAAARGLSSHAGAASAGTKPAVPAAKAGTSDGGIAVEIAGRVSAGEPPIASERVAEIRSALQDGSYPIIPTQIGDAMIAAQLSLTGVKS